MPQWGWILNEGFNYFCYFGLIALPIGFFDIYTYMFRQRRKFYDDLKAAAALKAK